jgi:hypothetical protein
MRAVAAAALSLSLSIAGFGIGGATPANAATPSCSSAPDGVKSYWTVTSIVKSSKSTGVHSDWVYPKYGPKTVSSSVSATATTSASFSVSVGAEAGVIFAKASVQAGVTVGGSWSDTSTWSYSATYPKDAKHEYREVLYQETRSFKAIKYTWKYNTNTGKCAYLTSVKSNVVAPRTSESVVWKTERRSA